MTAQVHETLIYEGQQVSMAYCPTLKKGHPRITNLDIDHFGRVPREVTTACHRGYFGTWEIINDRFYLVELVGRFQLLGKEPLFADWFSGVILIPSGEVLRYAHSEFNTTYEFERHIKIENGHVKDSWVVDNRGKNIGTSMGFMRRRSHVEVITLPVLWHRTVSTKLIVPTSSNVLVTFKEYLIQGDLTLLKKYKQQNLRDLKFPDLKESGCPLNNLLVEPNRRISLEILTYYKENLEGINNTGNLPRPIRNVFLVGWGGENKPSSSSVARHLNRLGYGGTMNATNALVTVGKTTGRLFGLLEDDGRPTKLFGEYFS